MANKTKTTEKQKTTDKGKTTMTTTTKTTAPELKTVIEVTDPIATVKEMIENGHLTSEVLDLLESGLIATRVEKVKVEKKWLGEYVKLVVGPNATTDEDVYTALITIAGGNLRIAYDENQKPTDAPSLEKACIYGADLLTRARITQRVRKISESPEKSIEKMAKEIQKRNPRISDEVAKQQARQFLEMMTALGADTDEDTENEDDTENA